MTKYRIVRECVSGTWWYSGYKKILFFWKYIPGTLSFSPEECEQEINKSINRIVKEFEIRKVKK